MSRAVAPFSLWSIILFVCFLANLGSLAPLQAQVSSDTLAHLLPAGRADRIAAHPEFGARQQLADHLPSWVRPENLSSTPVDLNAPMHVSLLLSRGDALQASFVKLLANQQDPSSPLYHRWLSPAQIGELFGPTDPDVQAVEEWAASQGLHVDSLAPSRTILELSGTATTVGNAFGVSFAYYGQGADQHLAPTAEPSIPAALSPVATSVQGLVQMPVAPQVHAVASASPALRAGPADAVRPRLTLSNGAHYITPADFAAIYDLASVYASGNTGATIGGKPQRIAVIGRSRVSSTDIAEFVSTTGIGAYTFNTILASSNDPGMTGNGDQVEATLDSQRTLGTAPGAQTDLVISANYAGNDGVYVAAAYNVNTLLDPIMSISFSGCEAQAGAAGVSIWNSLFSSAAAEGISVFVSAGDAGVAGCDQPLGAPPAVQVASINFICSSAYVTCVGGTELNDTAGPASFWSSTNSSGFGSALSYIPEGAWNEPSMIGSTGSYGPSASGGGASQYVSKPSWQTGAGVPADGLRDVPDLSLASSGHDGYYGCLAFAGGDCAQSHFEYFFGTSAAAPSMAGIAALLNTASGSAQGNLNPLFYRLAANTSAGAFHDITVASSGVSNCMAAIPSACNNSTPGVGGLSGGLSGYVVTPGYDQVTGLGSVDVARLLNANPAFTLSASPSLVSFSSGASSGGSAIVTVTSLNGFAGLISLSCNGSGSPIGAQPVCTIAPSSVTLAPGGTATANLTISSTGKQAGSSVAAGANDSFPIIGGDTALAILICCPPLRRRRKLLSLAVFVLLAGSMLGLGGCGSGGTVSATGNGNAVNYAFIITASSNAGTASVAKTVSTAVKVTVN